MKILKDSEASGQGGEAINSQGDEKKQTFGKQILAGPPRNNGTQRRMEPTDFCLNPPCLPHLIQIC